MNEVTPRDVRALPKFPPLRLRSAMAFGGLSPREVALRTWRKMDEHEIMTRAAAVSFYAMLALVPFLALVVTVVVQLLPDLTGHLARVSGIGNMTADQFRETLQEIFPREAYEVVADQMERLQTQEQSGRFGLLAVGLAVTVWLASSLFVAIIDAMNRIYGVPETRSFVRIRLFAIVMTCLQAAILIGSLLLIVLWPMILRRLGLGGLESWLATAVQWLVVTVMVTLSFALSFYVAPDAHQRWEWITPGSVLGAAVFLFGSYGFRLYVENFANYDKTYGSLGGVMVLLFWFWISSLVLLTAAQMNKVIEEASPLGMRYGQKEDVTAGPDMKSIAPEPAME